MVNEAVVAAMSRSMKAKEYKPASDGWTALSTLSLAAVPSITKFMTKRPILTPKNAVETLVMGGVGFTLPKVFNKALSIHKKDPVAARQYLSSELAMAKKHVTNTPVNLLNKEASVAALGGLALKGLRFGASAAKDLGRGLIMPINPKGIKNKALSWTSKGLAASAAIGAGGYFGRRAKSNDYVTYMRNQVLAGNITPEELSASDLESIRSRYA